MHRKGVIAIGFEFKELSLNVDAVKPPGESIFCAGILEGEKHTFPRIDGFLFIVEHIPNAVLAGKDPKVIIFDEATSALDVESEKYIQDSIVELIKDRTTFIVAHRLSTIRKAHRIIVLKKGRIAETGTHQELIAKNGIYAKMVAMQMVN